MGEMLAAGGEGITIEGPSNHSLAGRGQSRDDKR